MKTRTPAPNRPATTWRERFLEIARQAGEPLATPRPAASMGLRPRVPGLAAFARRRGTAAVPA